MSAPKFWKIEKWDSGAGVWLQDTQIPRAGLDNFSRAKDSTITFVTLVDGSEAKVSNETKSKWSDLTLTFPKQVMTTAVRNQLLTYIDNEWGVRITIPVSTGASSYTETQIEGYMTRHVEEWPVGDKEQEYVLKVDLHEFNVDGS